MPMILGLQVTASRACAGPDASVNERMLASQTRGRRRWVIRSGLMLVLTGVILCVAVAWRRDRETIASRLDPLAAALGPLQDSINTWERLPSQPELLDLRVYRYAAEDERYYAMNTPEPVIIAFTPPGREPIRLMLRSNGRAVLLHEKTPFSIPLAFEGELEKGIISEELRARLTENHVRLSPAATVPIREAGYKWLIRNDDGRWYTIIKEGPAGGEPQEALNVYGPRGKLSAQWMPEGEFRKMWFRQQDQMKAFDREIHGRPLADFLKPSG